MVPRHPLQGQVTSSMKGRCGSKSSPSGPARSSSSAKLPIHSVMLSSRSQTQTGSGVPQ